MHKTVIMIIKSFLQRETSANKSRNIVKGRKISQMDYDCRQIHFSPIHEI